MNHKKSGKKKQKSRHFKGRDHKRNTHHVYPRSRRKKGDLGKFEPVCRRLLLRTGIKEHIAWHQIFYNYFPEEVIFLIKFAFKSRLTSPPGIVSFIKKFYNRERAVTDATEDDLDAWREIFGNTSSWRKIRKIILKSWTYPGIKAIISNKGKVVGLMVFLKSTPKNASHRIKKDIDRCKDVQIITLKENQLLKIT